jgi:NhaP-type Na+/H+ or K+/H+ antiporter
MYDWHEALLLGSMLTCTDILSFVQKLKRGGTPQRITSLIEGESLFNYCTCVMIFQFIQYYKEVDDHGFETWDYLSLFFEYTVGGIIFGVVAGAIAVYCIKRMIYDGPLAVTLMVIFTYSIYLIAEYSAFRISGIISLSVFSLYMNAFGKTWLFGETE